MKSNYISKTQFQVLAADNRIAAVLENNLGKPSYGQTEHMLKLKAHICLANNVYKNRFDTILGCNLFKSSFLYFYSGNQISFGNKISEKLISLPISD